MTPLRAVVAALSASLTAGAALSEPCAPGFGVFYDELHAFWVEAPAAWCCVQAERGDECRPSGAVEASPVIRVSFRYLDASETELAALAASELAALAPGASPVEQPGIHTQSGSSVRVWDVSRPGSNQHLVGLLIHEVVLVRFVLEQPSASDGRLSAAEAFRQLVSSFRGNAQAAEHPGD